VVRVVVADAAPLFRRGAVAALEEADGILVVADVEDAEGLRAAVDANDPDVVLLDAWLGGEGVSTCAEIAAGHPGVRVLVVASAAVPVDLATVVGAGATGYLAREATAGELVDAVRTSAEGRALLSPEVATQLLDEFASLVRRREAGVDAAGTRLTGRELEVLRLVAQGLNNRAIAERLYISENTVKNHVRSIHEKLQVHSRMEAVVRAVRDGLLEMA
jgi:two-component system NarL family response regulator